MSDEWYENEEEEEEIRPRPVRRRRATRNNEQRGNLYLLTGLVLGVGLGLVYAWLINPVKFVDTQPSSLATPYKDEYRRLIALAYAADHNLVRARERLALVDAGSPVQILASQAQRMLAENQPPQDARALAILAADLSRAPAGAGNGTGQAPSPQAVAGASTGIPTETTAEAGATLETTTLPAESALPAGEAASATPDLSSAVQTPTLPPPTRTPTITNTPVPTYTLRPTATPNKVLDAPFALKSKREVCDGSIQPGLLQVLVTNASGAPLPGVRIAITWQGGQDTFFTGLAPEISPGYADFSMQPGTSYNLKIGDASKPVSDLKTDGTCGWKLEFTQQENG